MVTEKLTALVNSVNPEPDKFISCVHKLQLNYPPIADRCSSCCPNLDLFFQSVFAGYVMVFYGMQVNIAR